MVLPAILTTLVQAQPTATDPPSHVSRASGPIRVDGAIDEPAWRDALALDLPYETEPGENTPADVATTCWITYDQARLYVACRADDPAPKEIRARYTDRDQAFSDDVVGVKLDTFNDGRRAFQFFVNPLGVQMDILQDDVNGGDDSSWDTIWDSAGRITETGYEVEISVPFSSLRFQRGEGDQTWGLDLVRFRPRSRVYRLALNTRDRGSNCELCRNGRITGFTGAEPGKNLEIVPTLTAIRDSAVGSSPAGGLSQQDQTIEPGLTLRWGFTPNLALSATANPDFSQVEADSARLDVNEEFALFYPEKRPFFLEGADFFTTPIDAVYSRTVADPSWGTKVTGKEGANALGIMVAQDEITNLLLPGKEGSDATTLYQENLSTILRYRRDLGRSSAAGALVTLRDGDGYSNLVVGLDAVIQPTPSDSLRAQALRSETEYPWSGGTGSGSPAEKIRDDAFVASYRHEPRNWLAYASYSDYGKDFRADLGFVPQVDFTRAAAGGGYKWYGDARSTFSRIQLMSDWDETKDQSGNLIEREIEAWFEADGARDSSLYFGMGRRTRVYNGVSFDQEFASAGYELDITPTLRAEIDVAYGDEVDVGYDAEPGVARQGKQLDINPEIRWTAGRHLSLTLGHRYRTLDLPEGRLFRADLTELRLVYQFDVRMFLRLIAQHADVAYAPPPLGDGEQDRDLFAQILFSYKVNPQTALYLGADEKRADIPPIGLTPTNRTLFVKLGYAWVP